MKTKHSEWTLCALLFCASDASAPSPPASLTRMRQGRDYAAFRFLLLFLPQ